MEKVIKAGALSFWDIGAALQIIADKQLYRLKFPTFKSYLSIRWNLSTAKAKRMMDATFVRNELISNNSAIAKTIASLPVDISFYIAVGKLESGVREKVIAKLLATKTPLSAYQVNEAAGVCKDKNHYVYISYRKTINGIKAMIKDPDLNRFFTNANKKYTANIKEDFINDLDKLLKKLT